MPNTRTGLQVHTAANSFLCTEQWLSVTFLYLPRRMAHAKVATDREAEAKEKGGGQPGQAHKQQQQQQTWVGWLMGRQPAKQEGQQPRSPSAASKGEPPPEPGSKPPSQSGSEEGAAPAGAEDMRAELGASEWQKLQELVAAQVGAWRACWLASAGLGPVFLCLTATPGKVCAVCAVVILTGMSACAYVYMMIET